MTDEPKVRSGRECRCGEDRVVFMVKHKNKLDGHGTVCLVCHRDYAAANAGKVKATRQAAKPEKVKVNGATYYEANREKVKAYQAAYREANDEKVKARKAAYRAANAHKIKASSAAYRKANAEKIKASSAAYRARLAAQREGADAHLLGGAAK